MATVSILHAPRVIARLDFPVETSAGPTAVQGPGAEAERRPQAARMSEPPE